MSIDIDRLSEDELVDLHARVTERLRMIQQLRAHGTMLKFSIGDRVAFDANGRRVFGVISRYNRKTVTVIADGGHRWNVSPGFLVKVTGVRKAEAVVEVRPSAAADVLARVGGAGGGGGGGAGGGRG